MAVEPKILGIFLADTVIKDVATSKLSLINCFSQINVIAFPTQAAPFFIIAQVKDLVGKIDQISFGLSITHSDTKEPVMTLNSVSTIPEGVAANDINELIWPVPPLIFIRAGEYTVTISSGTEVIGKRNFKVVTPTQSPQFLTQNVTGS
jgi:hypothetical protein